ncbi:MAG: PstS family phosphate ABC transporter substrate-binding protein [Actinobacteria bacterium]|nr:PstS family phosphate ABC transporter substrate-binding protein [Actinomycetota bacterium]
MRNPTARRVAAGLLLTALLGAACGNADTDPSSSGDDGGQSISGSIAIDGSSTVFPIAQAAAEEFQISNPDAQVSVGFAGTGGGFEAFCAGDTQISNASRAIEKDEVECLEEAGIEYTEFQVAVDGLAIVTNPETDWVDCITFDQLKAIYEPGSDVSTWSDVDPSWPDEELKIFGPDPDSGTYDYLAETVADPDADEPATRDDMTQSADDNVLVQGVQGEPGSIGYFGFAYYEENAESLKALEVDDGSSGCVAPSAETVKSNEYPLSRPLFIYVANDAMDQEVVSEFVTFWVQNAGDYATAVGYVETPNDVAAENEQALEGLAS